MTLQHVERGRRRQSRAPLHQRLIVLSAVILALGVFWGTVGLLQALTPRAADHVSAENDLIKRSPTTGSTPVASAPLSVAVLPGAQALGAVSMAGAPTPDPKWWSMRALKTVDGDPGGTLQFDAETGEVKVCDVEEDGHLVRGKVTLQEKVVQAQDGKKLAIRAGEKGKCYVKTIENFNQQQDYKFHICLAASDESPDGYCNTSGNTSPWPQPDRKEDYCNELDGQEHLDCTGGEAGKCSSIKGPAKEYCEEGVYCTDPEIREKYQTKCKLGAGEWHKAIPPPSGRIPSLNETPDLTLPTRPVTGYDNPRMAVPIRKILTWLTWATLGACVAGYMLIGAKMAISHKRGEVHAHGVELGWVLIATVIAATGMAIYFVGLVVLPI